MKKRNWKNYAFEFLSIFVAVISAFALNNWNENRRENQAETKILVEILNGLEKDLEDVRLNVLGHQMGINACRYFRKMFSNQKVQTDSLRPYYFSLTRDFVSVQNTSGYETLKSRGLELLKNDSLRTHIISLYEYDYSTLKKLEEEYHELQFQENYFQEINRFIAPKIDFDSLGEIAGLTQPLNLKEADKKVILSYLWKIESNRKWLLQFYGQIEGKIQRLRKEIEDELNR